MTRRRSFPKQLVLVPVLVLALAGCAAGSSGGGGGGGSAAPSTSSDTVSLAKVASSAEQALAGSGTQWQVDCGTGDTPASNGAVIDCTATDPSSGKKYDATATLSDDNGSWNVDAKVLSTPAN